MKAAIHSQGTVSKQNKELAAQPDIQERAEKGFDFIHFTLEIKLETDVMWKDLPLWKY